MAQDLSGRIKPVKCQDRFGALFLVVALMIVASLAAPFVWAGDSVIVSQRNREFSPDHVRLARGSKLHVVNDDNVTHHIYVKSPEMTFDSGGQPIGSTVVLTFDEAGYFKVRCAIHQIMRLDVTVE